MSRDPRMSRVYSRRWGSNRLVTRGAKRVAHISLFSGLSAPQKLFSKAGCC